MSNTLNQNNHAVKVFEPNSQSELFEIIKAAKLQSQEIYIVSQGKNWGYGCSNPVSSNSYLINLSKLNEIGEFDEEHGLITIQPGVTFGELADFLISKGDKWIAPVIGGGPNCSVMGNALERGYGITPNTDHFAAVNHLRAILNDGTFYEGSLTSLGQERLDKLFRYGVGPYVDGAFTQSGLGAVYEVTIKLAPKPKYIEMFYFNLKENNDLESMIALVKDLKLSLGDTLGGVNFLNTERALSMTMKYPVDKVKVGEMLSEAEINSFARTNLLTPWLVVGALYGEKEIVKVAKKILKRKCKKHCKRQIFYNSSNRNVFKTISQIIPRLGSLDVKSTIEKLDGAFEILNGRPSTVALELAYWKNERTELLNSNRELNPAEDGCGLIWYAPLVEFTPHKVREYVRFIDEASKKFKMNSLITVTTIDHICLDSTIPILFNKNLPEETERAWKYYEYLLEEGAKKGFYPYRFNTKTQREMSFSGNKVLRELLIKSRYKE